MREIDKPGTFPLTGAGTIGLSGYCPILKTDLGRREKGGLSGTVWGILELLPHFLDLNSRGGASEGEIDKVGWFSSVGANESAPAGPGLILRIASDLNVKADPWSAARLG